MTTITIFKSKEGSYKGFTCKGHAGFAKFGKDIVCAAVSMTVINTINSISELVHDEIVVDSDDATGYINCRFPGEITDQTILLLDSMILGLDMIKQQYGKKHLNLIFEEV